MDEFCHFLVVSSTLCMLLSLFLVIEAAPQTALVSKLPGFEGTFPSKHYSGYVNIGGNPVKNLFYYFVLSERNPLTDPVVLWLNGGPGCSSFDGFIYEHGPFNFEAGTNGGLPKLHLNQYSWTKVSSIIYLDSPAGVGFSYATNSSAYTTGDKQTAADTHDFLLKWFKQYPEFLSNPFYIAGESYAGVYVPTLASELVKGIETGTKPVINLKGYIVGNGVTDSAFDGNALVPFAHGMALISDDIYQDTFEACHGVYHGDVIESCGVQLDRVDAALRDINIYDVLEPCYHEAASNSNSSLPSSFQELGKTDKPLPVRKRIFGRAWPFRAQVNEGYVPSWPEIMMNPYVPCFNDEVATAWLNNKAVRTAIHAEQEKVTGQWELCTTKLSYYRNAGSMIPYHKNITSRGYKALIFSGDHDMCVPYTGTEAWTKSLGYKIVDEWRPWMTNNQVAGYTQGYANGLTFLTVKGAGHTVPEYKPREAFYFYSQWLEGKSI